MFSLPKKYYIPPIHYIKLLSPQDNATQLNHYSDKHEPLTTCLKMLLNSCFASIWKFTFSVQVPAIVAHHSIVWLPLVTCFNLRNVSEISFTVLSLTSPKLSEKSLSVHARKGSLTTSDNQASDMQSTCLAQHRRNSRFFRYIENCVSFARTISKHPTPGYSNGIKFFILHEMSNIWSRKNTCF